MYRLILILFNCKIFTFAIYKLIYIHKGKAFIELIMQERRNFNEKESN